MEKKGDIEISEMFIVLLLLVGVLTAVWIVGWQEEIPVTDKSTDELLDDGLKSASEYFYQSHPEGDYIITTHKWSLGNINDPPDSIPYTENMTVPEFPVLFDGTFLYGTRGFAAKIYERVDEVEPMAIECAAVFIEGSDTMDDYYRDEESFMIRFYTYYKERKLLEDCIITSYGDSMTEEGTFVRTYHIHCNVIWRGYF